MEADEIKALVSEVFDRLGCTVDSIEVSSGQRTVVAISSPHSAILIGTNGENLQALNTIVRRIAEKKHGADAANFLIDINNFHENRLTALRENVNKLAQRVRLFKHEVDLEPMNSYERLVIHELFADDPEVQSASDGEGKMRHIVLKVRVTPTPHS